MASARGGSGIAGRRSDGVDRRLAVAFVLVALGLRVVLALRMRVDSDEPQHLHVVWAWTQGLLPYRDVFDNHMPLFQMLCAPILRLVGERPDAVVAMRLSLLPCFGLLLWGVHRIARALFSPRDALWAVVLASCTTTVSLCSIEFRTDVPWTVCWVGALAVAVGGPLTSRRALVAGALLGAALAVSLKTVLMLLAVAGGATAAVAVSVACGGPRPRRGPAARGAALGLVAAPLAVTVGFALAGALHPYLYDTILHNALPGLGHPGRSMLRRHLLAALATACGLAVTFGSARSATPGRAARRTLVAVATFAYAALLYELWPLLTRQDLLPVVPLATVFATPVLCAIGDRLATLWPRAPRAAVPAMATLVALALVVARGRPWEDGERRERALVAEVLRLTAPGDRVLDSKGDAIFRARSIDYVLEGITKTRIARGLVPDDVPERLVATHTTVSLADSRDLTPRARRFLRTFYVPVGDLRVAGARIPAGTGSLGFDIAIPAAYAIVSDRGRATGLLDGTSYEGPRTLAAGHHEFLATDGAAHHVALWAPAVDRGFTPSRPARAAS